MQDLIQELLTGQPDNSLDAHFRHIFQGSSANDWLPYLHWSVDRSWHHGDFLQVVAAIGYRRGNGIVLSLMGEGLLIEALEDNFHLLFEELLVGVVVEHRRPERLDLTRVIAPADAEKHSAAGEDVGHGEILGKADRVPHRDDIEGAAKFELLRLCG